MLKIKSKIWWRSLTKGSGPIKTAMVSSKAPGKNGSLWKNISRFPLKFRYSLEFQFYQHTLPFYKLPLTTGIPRTNIMRILWHNTVIMWYAYLSKVRRDRQKEDQHQEFIKALNNLHQKLKNWSWIELLNPKNKEFVC